jgi:hypothetical protein
VWQCWKSPTIVLEEVGLFEDGFLDLDIEKYHAYLNRAYMRAVGNGTDRGFGVASSEFTRDQLDKALWECHVRKEGFYVSSCSHSLSVLCHFELEICALD